VSAASGLVEDLGAHRCMLGSLMEDRKAPLHETAVRAVGSKEDGPREEMSLLRVHYHEQRRSENLRPPTSTSLKKCQAKWPRQASRSKRSWGSRVLPGSCPTSTIGSKTRRGDLGF
jgi:hypothetical protein